MADPAPFFPDAALPLRDTLNRILHELWPGLGGAGEWWSGADRIAIAREARAARDCDLCARRKAALSPYEFNEFHKAASGLSAACVDAVHRITTDPGRLSSRWQKEVLESGVGEEELVEMIGDIALVTAADTLAAALGAPLPPFPSPVPGEPRRRRPAGAKVKIARVATVAPKHAEDELAAYYERVKTPFGPPPYIMQSLTLVPRAQIELQRLMAELYFGPEMLDMRKRRELERPQMELLAAHVSAFNECFY